MTKIWRLLIGWLLLLSPVFAAFSQPITIATGEKGGLYHQLAQLLGQKVKQTGGPSLISRNTSGSNDNLKLLQQGKVDFAIVQAGTQHLEDMAIITPLFIEPVMVLAKRNVQVEELSDMQGKVINLGAPGSGSRVTGERILNHYEIDKYRLDDSYIYAQGVSKYDASIVVGGLLNNDIRQVIRQNNLKLIPIEAARAIALKHTHLHPYVIPRGVFSEKPAIPSADIQSIASTAILVSRQGIDQEAVESVLKAIYETDLRTHFPLLMTPAEVKQWSLFPLTPQSLNYLDPYSGIGVFANFAESIAAIKEIIFALIAVAYFCWVGWRRLQQKKAEAHYSEFKEKLDVFLDESVRLERQCSTPDRAELEVLLNQAIELKLKALTELTHERLRGDNLFAIFLSQCSNLIFRIEQKLK